MKTIVLATTNHNKVKRLKNLLKKLDIEVIPLNDIKQITEEPQETANTCGGIAIEKALYYVSRLPKNTIILTQDDTISFSGIDEIDNPGVHIKEPVIKKHGEFTDEKAAEYYVDLANKYGGSIPMTFHYGHALAIANDGERNFTKIVASESKLETRLVNHINKLETIPGYFLGAITQVKVDNEWIFWNDLTDEQLIKADIDLYNSISKLVQELGVI
jgi:inosine/xanthosine triphosphate pyrophosphatase family protein